jgi:uncharacterized protein (TIGR02597 family)
LAAQTASAWEVDGFSCVEVKPESDSIVSVPFVRAGAREFTATGVAGSVITVGASTGFGTNELMDFYYVRLSNGKWSTLTANTATTFTVADASILAGFEAGQSFKLFRHQTFESVFPDAFEGVSYLKSASGFTRSTEVIVLSTGIGINKAAQFTYFYLNGEWRRIGSAANQDNTVIPPQSLLIIRNGRASGKTLKFYTFGDVDDTTLVQPLAVGAVANDVPTAHGSPTGRTLAELNLANTPAFVSSASGFAIRDQIIVFDNSATGQNKAAFATYFHLSSGSTNEWRRIGSGANQNNTIIPPGTAFVIRKFAGTPGTVDWTQNQPSKFD